MFGAIDWLVLLAYLGISAWVGLRLSGSNKNFREYMLGSGAMPWVAVGVSLIATSVSATTFLGAPADVYAADMTFLMFQFGSFLSIVVVGTIFIPRFRQSGATSAYALLEERFSRPVRRLAATLYSLHLLLRTGILLYAPSIVLAGILDISVGWAILLTAVVAVAYTWHGGIQAVIWTDVFQFVVFCLGGIAVLFVVGHAVGGWGEVVRQASEAGKTHWLELSLDPRNARTILSAALAYGVLETAIRGCDQQFVQRYLSCRDPREANRSSVLSMVLGVGVSLLFYWVGAALFVYYGSAKAGVLPSDVGVNGVFPWFILHELPVGLRGVVVAAIYAAAMSSLSSAINSLANTTESDLLCTSADSPGRLRRAKLWTLAWGVLGVGAAFAAQMQEGSLLRTALFFTGLFTGPLLGLFLLAFFAPRVRPAFLLAGVGVGMASLVPFSKIPFVQEWEPVYPISWPWNPLISLTGMMVAVALLSLMGGLRRDVSTPTDSVSPSESVRSSEVS